MRAREFIVEGEQMDEGKLGKAVGTAALAGTLGAAGYGAAHLASLGDVGTTQKIAQAPAQQKQDLSTIQAKPKANVQQVAQTEPKAQDNVQKVAQDNSDGVEVKPLTANQLEHILLDEAKAAGIDGVELASFMSQMAHECDYFRDMVEDHPNVKKYGTGKTAKILGNKSMNDAKRFIGRGYIQLTGRWNYEWMEKELGIDLTSTWSAAHQAADPHIAAKIAIAYWKKRVRPHVSNFNDVRAVTKKINPGLHGLKRRANNFSEYMTLATSKTPTRA